MSSIAAKIRQLAQELHIRELQTRGSWSQAHIILREYIDELLKYGVSINSEEVQKTAHKLAQIMDKSNHVSAKLLRGIDRGVEFLDFFTSKGAADEEKKEGTIFTPTLETGEALEQIASQNKRIDAMVNRVRILPKLISGERVLRTRLQYDATYPVLTRKERYRNRVFLNQFNWVQDGIGGVGHQQPLPFELGLPSGNHLDYRNKIHTAIRYSGDLFDGGVYVRKRVFPTRKLQEIYRPSLIRKTAIWQRRMNQYVDAAGPGETFIMKETNDLMPPEVARKSLKNRLYFQTMVDGKWT